MSDLGLPPPDFSLGAAAGSHAEQTARVMVAYEKVCLDNRPDVVVVAGDVNSTLAAALAAKKLNLAVVHLEAGLRSGDRTMPEEINRLAIDAICDVLWPPSPDATRNLLAEAHSSSAITEIGNAMIDSYVMLSPQIESAARASNRGRYLLVTLHRPANVDKPESLRMLVDCLVATSTKLPIVFPVHPRTRKSLVEFGLMPRVQSCGTIEILEPQSYVKFMALVLGAAVVLTDSGGVQEETTYLGIPCLTLRTTTERPITITQGSNRLVNIADLDTALDAALEGGRPLGTRPNLWDGQAATRAAADLKRRFLEK